jgi:hypothetical protein
MVIAQTVAAEEDNNLMQRLDWSMDLDAPLGQFVPTTNLRTQNTKLRGKDVSIFNKLSYQAQNACKSFHLEAAPKHASQMEELVQYAKNARIIEKIWGNHVHVSEVTDG